MPSETKETLLRKIQELGGNASSSATTMQLRARLAELRLQIQDQPGVLLKDKLVALNKAAKKKDNIVALAQEHKIEVTRHQTIPQIYAKLEEKFTMETPPTAMDKVNFGKWADLTYGQMALNHKDYLAWCAQTFKDEGDNAHWRLVRLAKWFQMEQIMPSTQTPMDGPPRGSSHAGYPSQAAGKKSHSQPSDFSDSSFQAVEGVPSDTELQLMRQLEQLKKEKEELELMTGRVKSRKEM